MNGWMKTTNSQFAYKCVIINYVIQIISTFYKYLSIYPYLDLLLVIQYLLGKTIRVMS